MPAYHVIDIFEDGCEATDDEGELVLGDVDQTFFVVLCADFGVGVLVSNFDGKLEGKTRKDGCSVQCAVLQVNSQ